MSTPPRNLAGKTFGQLTAIEPAGKATDGHTLWRCRCSCGNEKEVASNNLGRTTFTCRVGTCWVGHRSTKHGHTKGARGQTIMSPAYNTWRGMMQRCTNPNTNRYKIYGGRGITVCERWREFKNFLEDMGERPDGTSIDRINVDGNYTPSNCRWATPKEQVNNRRSKAA